MFVVRSNSTHYGKKFLALALLSGLVLAVPTSAFAGKKKKEEAAPKPPPVIDYSNIVWPNPPAIARIKYQAYYASQQSEVETKTQQTKSKWMDRLAGTQPAAENTHVRFLLNQPYGVAIDSKGRVYTPDQKVGAIFIFNTETREAELIKNKVDAHFVQIIGIAMDDNDRLFVGDPGLKHVLVLNADHKPEAAITEGMVSPGGLAIDRENRLLYVSDVALDQVLVYDADSFKLLRKIGRTGHNHELTEPGDLAKPTGLAVDRDGNLYVCDTLNDRIEIFDADGNFIRTYGKNGDGPADFTRPKGVALDSDNHIWVADGMQDRLQVFNQEWRLLIVVGGHGLLPGMFQGLSGIAIDKNNRVFTSEIYPGRIQQFQYVTDAQFDAEKKRREEKGVSKTSVSSVAAPATAAPPAESKSAK